MSFSAHLYDSRKNSRCSLYLIDEAAKDLCEKANEQKIMTLSRATLKTYTMMSSQYQGIIFKKKILREGSIALSIAAPVSLVSYVCDLISYNFMVFQTLLTIIVITVDFFFHSVSRNHPIPRELKISKREATEALCKLLNKAEEALEGDLKENREWPTCSISCSNVTLFPISASCKGNPQKLRHHFAADHLLTYFQNAKKLTCPACRQPITQVESEKKVQEEVLSAFTLKLNSAEFQEGAARKLGIRMKCIRLLSKTLANALTSHVRTESDRYLESIRAALLQDDLHSTVEVVDE